MSTTESGAPPVLGMFGFLFIVATVIWVCVEFDGAFEDIAEFNDVGDGYIAEDITSCRAFSNECECYARFAPLEPTLKGRYDNSRGYFFHEIRALFGRCELKM